MKYLVTISLLLLASVVYGSGETADSSSGSVCFLTGSWTSCDSIFTSDNIRATTTSASTVMADSGYSFSLTSLDSFRVLVEGNGTAFVGGQRDINVWFSQGGTSYGDTVTIGLPRNTDAVVIASGTTNGLWGTGFDETDLNNGTTAVRIRADAGLVGTIKVDHVQIEAWYTVAGGSHGQVIRVRSY